jgi:hypothetical protein
MTDHRSAPPGSHPTPDAHPPDHSFTNAVEEAHTRALHDLTQPSVPPLDAVVWLSAHLAAVEHVIYPVMEVTLSDQGAAIERQRNTSHAMQKALRALEERCTGDAQASHASIAQLRAALVPLLVDHAAAEHRLLEGLGGVLDEHAITSIAADYERAVSHGPTRPHPHGPHRGRLERLGYPLDALRDHILDVVDSRRVPLPPPAAGRRRRGR